MTAITNDNTNLIKASVSIGGQMYPGLTVKEIVIGESLTTPGLQTAVALQSHIYSDVTKNYDQWKGKNITIGMAAGEAQGPDDYMSINQVVYRMDNREFMPVNVGQTEEFILHACDPTLLHDAKALVSKSWKCTSPNKIVKEVLADCIGATNPDVESCGPSRDYLAENIHPFQVISQQANVALADGDDPSFVHYMTFDETQGGIGKHHFRSLKSLCKQAPKKVFYHSEGGVTYNENPGNHAFVFSFPCDFDLLSDYLNGVDENGQNFNTFSAMNFLSGMFKAFGNQSGMRGGCGIGSGNYKMGLSNMGTSQQQNGCEMKIEEYLLKRQARMGLIERDKIALRISVPWSPTLHAGDVITLNWKNKATGQPVYGSGDYIIVSMTHKLHLGGHSITVLDCASNTIGEGAIRKSIGGG